MQQNENKKLQENIDILESEVEKMRKSLDRKQNEVNAKEETIQEMHLDIKSLNQQIQQLHLENNAFEKLSSQNKLLLDTLQSEQHAAKSAQEQLKKSQIEAEEVRELSLQRAKSLAVKEAEYIQELCALKRAIADKETQNFTLQELVRRQQSDIKKLSDQLYFVDDLRSDQRCRSNQNEYKMMMELDKLRESLQFYKDEKETLMQTMKISTDRSCMLEERLVDTLENLDSTQEMLYRVNAKADTDGVVTKIRDRKQRKEMDALQLKLKQAMQKIAELRDRLSRAEGLVDYYRNMENAPSASRSLITLETSSGMFQESSSTYRGDDTMEQLQAQGKRSLLIKYLRIIAAATTTIGPNGEPRGCHTPVDLSRCAITDGDVLQLIDWFRFMAVEYVSKIDLRSNMLTSHGMSMLVTWLLSLQDKDIENRGDTLIIDVQFNLVKLCQYLHA